MTRAEGLTVGPLTIGAVTSVATQTLDASGKVTPSTQLQIDGVAVNGQSFGLSPDGFGGGGSTVPVPLNPTLESVLKASGISVRFVAPQTYPNRVVAPALEVTMPFDSGEIPGGQYKGSITLTMGFASAAMTPAPGLDTSLTEPIADTFSPVLSDPAPGEAADIGAAPPVDGSSGALTSADSQRRGGVFFVRRQRRDRWKHRAGRARAGGFRGDPPAVDRPRAIGGCGR